MSEGLHLVLIFSGSVFLCEFNMSFSLTTRHSDIYQDSNQVLFKMCPGLKDVPCDRTVHMGQSDDPRCPLHLTLPPPMYQPEQEPPSQEQLTPASRDMYLSAAELQPTESLPLEFSDVSRSSDQRVTKNVIFHTYFVDTLLLVFKVLSQQPLYLVCLGKQFLGQCVVFFLIQYLFTQNNSREPKYLTKSQDKIFMLRQKSSCFSHWEKEIKQNKEGPICADIKKGKLLHC